VVLNKVDMLGEGSEELLKKKMEALRKVFGKTRYGEKVTMVPFSTKLEGRVGEFTQLLKNTLLNSITIPKRNDKGNLLMLVDHCFPIKGKGSVVTGTVVEGAVKPGDEVEFPLIQERKKVKSMQMFRKPVNSAGQGDRVALLFTQLESDLIERGLCCSPGYVTLS
jgi:selenocysteine-specific elongation factor